MSTGHPSQVEMTQNVTSQLGALAAMPIAGGNIWDVACGIVALLFFYRFVVIIYRLLFSPLAKFPGPKLAAATSWYEAFFDLRSKNFPDVLSDLHDKYGIHNVHPLRCRSFKAKCLSGPIVRVNPTELSIRDAEYYNELYVHGGKRRTNLIAGNRAGLGMSGELLPSPFEVDATNRLRRRDRDDGPT